MIHIKQKPEYVDLDAPFTPLPKYGHLSKHHPEYAQIADAVASGMDALWDSGSWAAFREMAGNADAAIPPGGPERGRDVVSELLQFPARDGYMVEIKIYRSPKAQKNATLMLRMHGGGRITSSFPSSSCIADSNIYLSGWVVGGHETEGAENCHAAAYHNIVVVSIDYRM